MRVRRLRHKPQTAMDVVHISSAKTVQFDKHGNSGLQGMCALQALRKPLQMRAIVNTNCVYGTQHASVEKTWVHV